MDRAAMSQALAKAIAYKNAGKDKDAKAWGDKLVSMLVSYGLTSKG